MLTYVMLYTLFSENLVSVCTFKRFDSSEGSLLEEYGVQRQTDLSLKYSYTITNNVILWCNKK